MKRGWRNLAVLSFVALSGCAKHIAAPSNDPLLRRPPHSVMLISANRNGNGPGGIGGFQTSANAFVVYASTDPRDTLVTWYQNLAANDYRTDVQDHGDFIEIDAFSKHEKGLTATVQLSNDLPTDVIHAYITGPTTKSTELAKAPPDTKTYIAVAIGRG